MSRYDRPEFDPAELNRRTSLEAKTRLQFDWLRDDADRSKWLASLGGRVEWIAGRAPVQNDPAPPRDQPARQGHCLVALISHPADVARALTCTRSFGNIPYAELGGASFMLAIDPAAGSGTDWHTVQREVACEVLKFDPDGLLGAAQLACRQAAILSLRAGPFDLAELAEQAALRYFGLLFGFAGRDHLVLEDAARTGYRALQYLIVGRHFVSEPGTLPAAQQSLARLSTRVADLMDRYALLARSPRKPLPPASQRWATKSWPDGVQRWDELGLSRLGVPVLERLLGLACDPTSKKPCSKSELNGQDLCSLVGGLLVGSIGNAQNAVCRVVEQLFDDPQTLTRARSLSLTALVPLVNELLGRSPPVPFLPRRTLVDVDLHGARVRANTDCIIALVAPTAGGTSGCAHVWGEVPGKAAAHGCLGRPLIEPLLATLLHRVLRLPGLARRIDSLDGDPIRPQRLWGFGTSSFLLRHDREKERVQQPLIAVMRVKSPLAENAERLRRVIRSGAPRIESALNESRHVHLAWFEFMENDSLLVLRTVYDGDFDAYIEHFALKVGDLFDELFESLEGAPPTPVAEHPYEFVETIRRINRPPLAGYFYSAYPDREASYINTLPGNRP